jgi:hypothetical protein
MILSARLLLPSEFNDTKYQDTAKAILLKKRSCFSAVFPFLVISTKITANRIAKQYRTIVSVQYAYQRYVMVMLSF